jgi:hypothetical protein
MTTSVPASSRVRRLIEHQRMRGRAYPDMRYWERLHQLLGEEAERRGKTPPPAPLWYGLEDVPTELDRMDRFEEQLVWADRNSLLHRVQMFFEAMPPSGWKMLEE